MTLIKIGSTTHFIKSAQLRISSRPKPFQHPTTKKHPNAKVCTNFNEINANSCLIPITHVCAVAVWLSRARRVVRSVLWKRRRRRELLVCAILHHTLTLSPLTGAARNYIIYWCTRQNSTTEKRRHRVAAAALCFVGCRACVLKIISVRSI